MEANKQLRRHWKTWVTEKEILSLKESGLDTLRIPVGDWMYAPYGPFVGCMDGALDELNRVLRLCEKHDLKAVLDIHAMKGSQVHFFLLFVSIFIILHYPALSLIVPYYVLLFCTVVYCPDIIKYYSVLSYMTI